MATLVVVIVLSILCGMGLCCALGVWVARRYYGVALREMLEQRGEKRTWRRHAERFTDEDGPAKAKRRPSREVETADDEEGNAREGAPSVVDAVDEATEVVSAPEMTEAVKPVE